MARNDIQKGWSVFEGWTLEAILKYRARWIHLVYKVILPPELYDLAKENKEMDRVQKWAREQGWAFRMQNDSMLLMKSGKILGWFRPKLSGGQNDPHLEFEANIAGERIELVQPDEQNPNGLLDLLTERAGKG